MKEKLLKNLKAKGLKTDVFQHDLFVTYDLTENLIWTDHFLIDETIENTINKTLWMLNNLPKNLLTKLTAIDTPSYHKLLLTNTSNLFTVIIDYAKMDNITIDMADAYTQCVINDFVIYRCNDQGKEGMIVKKSIVSTKKTFKKDLKNLLEEFNQLQKGAVMDCSEINLKLTKDNFDPHALADYIEKHKDAILTNYNDKHLECLDIKLNITNHAITLEQLFKELKVYFKNHLEERFCAYQKNTDLSFGTTINLNKFEPLIPIKDFMSLLTLDNYVGVITYNSATDDDDHWDNNYKLKGIYTNLEKAVDIFKNLKKNHPYDIVLTFCQLDKDIDSPIYCYN